MDKSPEEEENLYLSDKRINDFVKKEKLKVWRILPLFISLAAIAGYLELWWMLIPMGGWLVWRTFKK
jgi:hypothetical protein